MIKRQIVNVSGREVLIRYAGSGPPIVLLHGSPNTGAILTPLINLLRDDYLAIAPDTPGNGESLPLPEFADSARAHADALNDLLDALGLKQVFLYGFHTGSVFAAEFSVRYPGRVSALVLDGYPAWTEAEAGNLGKNYLQAINPVPDGSHLAALWNRVIQQSWHFPWHIAPQRETDVAWLTNDLGNTTMLHDRAMELLTCHDTYAPPYAAALRADGVSRLQGISAPTLLTAAAHDPLSEHLSRIPSRREHETTVKEDFSAVQHNVVAWLNTQPAPPTTTLTLPAANRRFLHLDGEEILVEGEGDELILHDAGHSSRSAGPGLKIDLPGHGLTSAAWPESFEHAIELVAAIGNALGARRYSGIGLGQQLAGALRGEERVHTDIPVPSIDPVWHGGHLLAAWHFNRYRLRYRKWHKRTADKLSHAPLPDARELNALTIDTLRAGAQVLARTLPYSLYSR